MARLYRLNVQCGQHTHPRSLMARMHTTPNTSPVEQDDTGVDAARFPVNSPAIGLPPCTDTTTAHAFSSGEATLAVPHCIRSGLVTDRCVRRSTVCRESRHWAISYQGPYAEWIPEYPSLLIIASYSGDLIVTLSS
ncbi:hypothetical protein BJX64DRAFT_256864 [Aspergillus heterothallicus]